MSIAILLGEATLLPSVDLSLFSILIKSVGTQEVLVQSSLMSLASVWWHLRLLVEKGTLARFYQAEHELSPVGHAWHLWKVGRALDFMDQQEDPSCWLPSGHAFQIGLTVLYLPILCHDYCQKEGSSS